MAEIVCKCGHSVTDHIEGVACMVLDCECAEFEQPELAALRAQVADYEAVLKHYQDTTDDDDCFTAAAVLAKYEVTP